MDECHLKNERPIDFFVPILARLFAEKGQEVEEGQEARRLARLERLLHNRRLVTIMADWNDFHIAYEPAPDGNSVELKEQVLHLMENCSKLIVHRGPPEAVHSMDTLPNMIKEVLRQGQEICERMAVTILSHMNAEFRLVDDHHTWPNMIRTNLANRFPEYLAPLVPAAPTVVIAAPQPNPAATSEFYIKNVRNLGDLVQKIIQHFVFQEVDKMNTLLNKEQIVVLLALWNNRRVGRKPIRGHSKADLKDEILRLLMGCSRIVLHRPRPNDGDKMDELPADLRSALGSLEVMGPRSATAVLYYMNAEFDVDADKKDLRRIVLENLTLRFPQVRPATATNPSVEVAQAPTNQEEAQAPPAAAANPPVQVAQANPDTTNHEEADDQV
ncbi:uncharacterized protein LOC132198193 [Neocloeon triangulifer]|uniref:uncharacterized protein LOC132198193 n=1 Tax=Neocloeon triangulifer TaxID=2078957 RepID=UPI00286EBE91|nr:uncharacterized protein LOC132198193 [Neocloeon triangulifer]